MKQRPRAVTGTNQFLVLIKFSTTRCLQSTSFRSHLYADLTMEIQPEFTYFRKLLLYKLANAYLFSCPTLQRIMVLDNK